MSDKEYDVFISYADQDAAWVEGYLLDALNEAGVSYLDEAAFALGVPRLVEFERAIQNSQRTLLVLSPAYMAETFTQFVDLLAQSYGLETGTWPVIPLILKPVVLPPRLSQLVALDATSPEVWEPALAKVCEVLGTAPPPPPPTPACPYPGMVTFQESDSERFFGRDEEIKEILARLQLYPFLTIIGPSGSGKSSLVYAGVLPALRRSRRFGKGTWTVITMRPGETPLSRVQEILQGEAWRSSDRVILYIDQFEETFTLSGGEAALYQEAIRQLIDTPEVYILLTVRADFYAELMGALLWDQIQAHRLEIPPLGEAGLRQAIVLPAEHVGVYVESALVERLVADAAGEPGVLPLVQETLVLMWEDVERRLLPLRAYEALVLAKSAYGDMERTGLQVALARRADITLAALSAVGQSIARRLLLRLIQFGEGRADTRRQQPVSALRAVGDEPGLFEHTLQHLTRNRLLTLSSDEGAGDDRERQVDISHEALIRGWPALQDWLDERRDAEQTRRRLEAKTEEWMRMGEGGGGLLDQFELLDAEHWLMSPDASELGYSEGLQRLINASRMSLEAAEREKEAARQRELEQARTLATTQRQRAAIFLVGLVIAIILLGVASALYSQSNANLKIASGASTQAVAAQNTAIADRSVAQAASTQAVAGSNAAATAQAEAEIQRNIAVAESTKSALAQQEAEAQRSLAEEKAWQAEAERLAANAQRLLDRSPPLAALIALESQKLLPNETAAEFLAQLPYHYPPLAGILYGHTGAINSVAWSSDGQLASAADDATVIVWDPKTGEPAATLTGHENEVKSVAWSTDGRLASASDDLTIIIWNLESGQPAMVLRGHEDEVNSVAWSTDGRLASASDDLTVIVWDLDTGEPAVTLRGHEDQVNSLAWGPEGKLASASQGGVIIIWDLEQEQPGVILEGHNGWVDSVAWSPDGQLASASGDNTVIIWDLVHGLPALTLRDHANSVTSVAWSSDGRLASASIDESIIVWDVSISPNTGQLNARADAALMVHTDWVQSVAWDPAGRLASASADQTIIIWDLQGGQPVVSLEGHKDWVESVAWSPDGRLASGSQDETIIIWDPHTGRLVDVLEDHTDTVFEVAWSRDGRLASASEDSTIIVWNSATYRPMATLAGHKNMVLSVAWSSDGKLASGGADNAVIIWNPTLGQPEMILEGHKGWVNSVAWSPDGKLASGAADNTVIFWNLARGEPASILEGHGDWVESVAWSPDGKLASGSVDGSIIVWDLEDARPASTLVGHTGAIWGLAWSPTGQLASGGADNTIILWDVEHAQPAAVLSGGQRELIRTLAWHPDGTYLASGGNDLKVLLLDVKFAGPPCTWLPRNLTLEEWKTWINLQTPYEPTCPNLPSGSE